MSECENRNIETAYADSTDDELHTMMQEAIAVLQISNMEDYAAGLQELLNRYNHTSDSN